MSVHNSFTVGNNKNHNEGRKKKNEMIENSFIQFSQWQMDRQIGTGWVEQTKRWKNELMAIGIVNDVMDV